jgi:cell division protein FtsN
VLELFQPKKTEPEVLKELPEVKTFPVPVKNPDIIPAREVSTIPVVKSETIKPAVVQQSQKYYIIGGCFEKEENAVKFLDGLLQRGFDAEKAGVTKRGHLRISYKSFTEKDPAHSYLQKIRDEENASAWILKY